MHRNRDVLRQWPLVIERRSVHVPYEFERSRTEMLQCTPVHLHPIGSECLLCGYDGIRKQLEDVLARHASMGLPALTCRDDGRRFETWRSQVVPQSFEDCCTQ